MVLSSEEETPNEYVCMRTFPTVIAIIQ
jgi:hypothetical protein